MRWFVIRRWILLLIVLLFWIGEAFALGDPGPGGIGTKKRKAPAAVVIQE